MSDAIIHAENFVLRPIGSTDLDDIWPSVSDPDISRDMSWDAHREKSETLAFLERMESDWQADRGYTWSIRCRSTNEFCGIFSLISVQRSHRSLTYNRAELAYWCAKKWQRKGVMTTAGSSVIHYAFNTLNINRLIVSHHDGNVASEKLIKKLGFTLIGRERQAFQKSGVWIDTFFYDLLKSEIISE